MKYRVIVVALIATAVLLSLASVANAQANPKWLGTPKSGFTVNSAKQTPLQISATVQYSNANYGTGGVALRNRSKGEIQISGVKAPTQDAWLYWAVLLSNPSKTQLKHVATVGLQREYPNAGTNTQLTGTLLAIGADPCWGSSGAYVYRAEVPTSLAMGNGTYRITLGLGAGLSDGEDPWEADVVFPLWEGASLVIIGTGTANVGLYDGQAGTTFLSSQTNSYNLPAPFGVQALLDNFGYDGQIGNSRTPGSSNETTTLTGSPSGIIAAIAGPGGEVSDSDWDGSSGWPLPQLWDDTGHDISSAFALGDTGVSVTYVPVGDCLGLVGSVISVQ
jgi:hypothetical protein